MQMRLTGSDSAGKRSFDSGAQRGAPRPSIGQAWTAWTSTNDARTLADVASAARREASNRAGLSGVDHPMGSASIVPATSRLRDGSAFERKGIFMQSLLLVFIFAWVASPAFAQNYEEPRWPAPEGFVDIAQSDLSALSTTIPYIHVADEVDTVGWTEYNVTTAGGTGRLSSCANMDNTGTSDNSAAFNCMMRNMGDNALLYFPNGVYDFARARDGRSLFRFDASSDNRGIRCESRGAVLQTTGDHNNPVSLLNGEEVSLGSTRSWNGGSGATRGTTVIRVSSTSGFTAGGWVYLYASANSQQDSHNRHYYTKIESVGNGTITIDRPLPDDFNGGGATAAPWYPAENMVIENCTIRQENPDHQQIYLTWLVRWNGVGGGHIKNVHFNSAYQYHFLMENSARVLVTQTDFSDLHWDKPYNGYSTWIARVSDVTMMDGHMQDAPQYIACGSGGLGTVIAFMDIRGPVDNQPAFDRSCNEGSGNTCRQVNHGHPLHCSNNAGDLDGSFGDSACRGSRVDVVSGSILFHNGSCSQTAVIRNHIEPQIWIDYNGGPGRNNFFYGNTMTAGRTISAETASGSPGDFAVKGASYGMPPGYKQNYIWANNTIGNLGVQGGYNLYGDGVQVLDNVIRGRCYSNDGSGQAAHGGACSQAPQRDGIGGINNVFSNNTVGQRTRPGSYNRTMPSAPGFSDWSRLQGGDASMAPFVGPEMGDPEATSSCLPAAMRWYGGCP